MKTVEENLEFIAQVLDDWTATYAAEMCDPEHVKAAYRRINEHCGTLRYICDALIAVLDIKEELGLKFNRDQRDAKTVDSMKEV